MNLKLSVYPLNIRPPSSFPTIRKGRVKSFRGALFFFTAPVIFLAFSNFLHHHQCYQLGLYKLITRLSFCLTTSVNSVCLNKQRNRKPNEIFHTILIRRLKVITKRPPNVFSGMITNISSKS